MNTNVFLLLLVFYPLLGGIYLAVMGRGDGVFRTWMSDGVVIIEFVAAAAAVVLFAPQAADGTLYASLHIGNICGFGLNFCLDGFRLIYVLITAFMWMMTTLLSAEYFHHHENVTRFYIFFLLTLSATMGVFLAEDLYTLFIFFEVMSFTSYVWVAQEETEDALRAAGTYLAVAVMGGLVMLMGIFLLYHELGTLKISELYATARIYGKSPILYAAGGCMLFGFGAKAGAFPLHIWLPKAHPVAPAPASALLSGVLTKTGIFGILIASTQLFLHDAAWGKLILTLGVLTMFGGALLAVFSVDLKRTLACSSMSQIGFILVGTGMQCLLGEENALAVHGTFLHMANHSMIKLVLFMAAGVIYMNLHALDLNRIRGFGRKKPLLMVIFLTGALAIGGIPMFGGYISKTLIHESIVEFGGGAVMKAVEWIFLFSGGLTVAYMTKLFIAIFVEKNASAELQKTYDEKKKYMDPVSTFALAGSALALLIWGLFPGKIMSRAAELAQTFMNLEESGEAVHFFSLTNLSGAFVSIGIGAVVYLLFIRKVLMRDGAYINAWPAWLDVENLLYRPLLLTILPTICGVVFRVFDSMLDTIVVGLRRTLYKDSPIPRERVEGTILTDFAGKVMNALQYIRNRTWGRRDKTHKDYIHLMAVWGEMLEENRRIVYRSLTFGFILFGFGFSLMLIYMVWG